VISCGSAFRRLGSASRSFSNGLLVRDMGDKQVIADAKLRGPLAYLLHIEMAGVRIGFEQSVIGRFGLLAGLRR
jgi:hypothetical protein